MLGRGMTAFVDTDERILVNDTIGTVVDYLRSINDSTIGAVTFRQRWLAKDETMPRKYENEKKVIEWMPTQRYHNASAITGNGWVVKTILQPLKVFYMWIHYPQIMMKPYWGYSVKPEEGFSRHYRNDNAWSRQRLPEFGNFSMTEYPRKYNQQLVDAVTKRLKYVYEYEAEETNRVSRVENGYQDTIAPKIVV
ncbi:hypothetical protein WR25_14324 [Diploscapter pachys]|uniref:Glycosyltransferase family 92 protein n=1 Tax=Diploscapter pachys TaxID=2018661 RepID=A0A2A2KH21_9BILA|nr:hypothetical protein WR25_14324 [Diploscapter pachys]